MVDGVDIRCRLWTGPLPVLEDLVPRRFPVTWYCFSAVGKDFLPSFRSFLLLSCCFSRSLCLGLLSPPLSSSGLTPASIFTVRLCLTFHTDLSPEPPPPPICPKESSNAVRFDTRPHTPLFPLFSPSSPPLSWIPNWRLVFEFKSQMSLFDCVNREIPVVDTPRPAHPFLPISLFPPPIDPR